MKTALEITPSHLVKMKKKFLFMRMLFGSFMFRGMSPRTAIGFLPTNFLPRQIKTRRARISLTILKYCSYNHTQFMCPECQFITTLLKKTAPLDTTSTSYKCMKCNGMFVLDHSGTYRYVHAEYKDKSPENPDEWDHMHKFLEDEFARALKKSPHPDAHAIEFCKITPGYMYLAIPLVLVKYAVPDIRFTARFTASGHYDKDSDEQLLLMQDIFPYELSRIICDYADNYAHLLWEEAFKKNRIAPLYVAHTAGIRNKNITASCDHYDGKHDVWRDNEFEPDQPIWDYALKISSYNLSDNEFVRHYCCRDYSNIPQMKVLSACDESYDVGTNFISWF